MTLKLTEALDIFQENLPEIKLALISNMNHDLTNLPPAIPGEVGGWLRELEIKQVVDQRTKVIKRIVAKLQPIPATQAFNRITDLDIERAKEYPIEEQIAGQRLFKSSGKWILNTHCPLPDHAGERTPSFYIDKSNRYKCFGCGKSGDAISFYMEMNGVNFIQAVKKLNNI